MTNQAKRQPFVNTPLGTLRIPLAGALLLAGFSTAIADQCEGCTTTGVKQRDVVIRDLLLFDGQNQVGRITVNITAQSAGYTQDCTGSQGPNCGLNRCHHEIDIGFASQWSAGGSIPATYEDIAVLLFANGTAINGATGQADDKIGEPGTSIAEGPTLSPKCGSEGNYGVSLQIDETTLPSGITSRWVNVGTTTNAGPPTMTVQAGCTVCDG